MQRMQIGASLRIGSSSVLACLLGYALQVETETVLHVCGTLAKGWVFEQSYLDPVHCVAVALAPRLQNARADAAAVPASTEGRAFEVLGLQELLKHAQPLRPPEQTLAKVILGKPVAP